jgi:hypothetical protein
VPPTSGSIPTPTSSPSNQSSDQDISSPLLIDYLKTRCYLYKFTPEVSFGGKVVAPAPPPIPKSTTSVISTKLHAMAAQVYAFNQALLNTFIGNSSADISDNSFAVAKVISTFVNSILVPNNGIVLPTATSSLHISLYDGLVEDANDVAAYLVDRSDGAPPIDSQRQAELLQEVANLETWAASAYAVIINAATSADAATSGIVSSAVAASYTATALQQFKVNRFVYDLNTKDLSRFDLSRFISNYSVQQQLGDISTVGTMSSTVALQNAIIPLQDLGPIASPTSVRRPMFFPNAKGDYAGYVNGLPSAASPSVIPSLDPISLEPISTLQADELMTRIAMAQTLEDDGGAGDGTEQLQSGVTSPYPDAFLTDVDRVEIAIRLRGIANPRKKELIAEYFSTGKVSTDLIRLLPNPAQNTISGQVATAALATSTALSNLVTNGNALPGLTQSQQAIANQLTAKPGDTATQLANLSELLTDAKVDGIAVGDLVQKYDFFSIFVYKHEVSPDAVEETLTLNTNDPYFFDKESLPLVTPFVFYLNNYGPGATNTPTADSRVVPTYASEFNGFVAETTYSSVPGSVNMLNLNLMSSMGLMGATKRIYNATIYQQSVFDAAETFDSDIFNLYQNLYVGKDPLQILTILLDSLYLLRIGLPYQAVQKALSTDQIAQINATVAQTLQASAPSLIAAQQSIAVAAAQRNLQQTSIGGRTVRDSAGNLSSFLDILSMRAFNQFGVDNVSSDGSTAAAGAINLFNMASFLYANVMRQRRFNVRVATESQIAQLDELYGGTGVNTGILPFFLESPENTGTPFGVKGGSGFNDLGAFQPFISSSGQLIAGTAAIPKECDGSGGSILEINPFLDTAGSYLNSSVTSLQTGLQQALDWKTYFVFLSSSFDQFVADLKTPYEIMGDVVSSCYLELFETPGGRFIFRTPQYNNKIPLYRLSSQDGNVQVPAQQTLVTNAANGATETSSTATEASNYAHMITSTDIYVISSEYSQSAKNLVSKQAIAYGADLIGVPVIPQLYYFYSNGKMIAQYGLTLGKSIENPNVRAIPHDKIQLSSAGSTIFNGIFHYCRFFLEYANMNNFTATITAIADPVIQAGRTYFDIQNQKFGYISNVTKNLEVGGTYTCTFTLKAVRDAVYGVYVTDSGSSSPTQPLSSPTFRYLPEMEQFIGKFTGNNTIVKNLSTTQVSKAGPAQVFQPLPTSARLAALTAASSQQPGSVNTPATTPSTVPSPVQYTPVTIPVPIALPPAQTPPVYVSIPIPPPK